MRLPFEKEGRAEGAFLWVARLLVLGILFVSPCCVLAQNPASQTAEQKPASAAFNTAKISKIEKAVQAEMKKQNEVVGLAVGIISEGRIVYVKGFGYADLEKEIPVGRETMFRWASCAKPITAIAALQLVEKGKLDLEADIQTYVPEFPHKAVRITTRDLLCHQSGISHYGTNVISTKRPYTTPNPFEDVVLALDHFKETPLLGEPREKYIYSTYGYILLSAVVQRAGHEKFADQVRNRIVRPLGMTTFQPDYQWVNIPNRAVGYRKFGKITLRSSDTDVSYKLGGGGFISNVDDFALFAQALMNQRLITEDSEKLMWVQQELSNGKTTSYGLGFGVRNKRSDPDFRISHTGSQEKTKTCFLVFPNAKRAVVVMSNSEWANPETFCRVIDEIARSPTAVRETSSISND